MRLFFKHLLRDIIRFPIQPLLILLTLTLSVGVGVSAFKTQKMFRERALWLESSYTRLGDVLITPGASDMRMIFDSDAKALIGENDRMLGEFSLSALAKSDGEHTSVISVSGVDLEAADEYFEFDYVEYGKFTTENLLSSAIISQSFAKELSLAVGDAITISLLGREIDFKIQAVAKDTGLLEERDVLIPIEALRRELAISLPSVAVLGEAFMPYTQIMIRLDLPENAESTVQRILENENMQHCNAEICTNHSITNLRILTQTGAIFLIGAVVIVLCAILNLTCMRLLEEKRRRDYALFASAGAELRQINMLRMGESLIYALIACVLGIPLAAPIIKYVSSLITRPEGELTIGLDGVIFGTVFSFAFITLCTLRHISRVSRMPLHERLAFETTEEKKNTSKPTWVACILLLIIALLFVSFTFIKTSHKPFVSVGIILTLVVFALLYVPSCLKALARLLANTLKKKRSNAGDAILLLRAFENNYSIKHICMILTVSITLLASVFLCQNTASEILNLLNTSLECEHVVIGADPAALQHIKDNYSPLSLCELSIHTDAELGDGFVTVAISAYGDYRDVISPEVLPEKLPEGKAVALTRSLARLCRVSVGDSVPLRLNGNVYELTVSEVFDSKSLAVFFDAKSLGIRTDICGFDLPGSVNTEENLLSLKRELELNGSSLERASVIFERIYKTGAAFTTIVRGAFFLSAVLTAAACMNSIFSGYRRRRQEFKVLALSGMTKRRINVRIASELLCVLLFSCVFALPLCAIAFTALELGAASFGLTLF